MKRFTFKEILFYRCLISICILEGLFCYSCKKIYAEQPNTNTLSIIKEENKHFATLPIEQIRPSVFHVVMDEENDFGKTDVDTGTAFLFILLES